jgi:hypothetical protein
LMFSPPGLITASPAASWSTRANPDRACSTFYFLPTFSQVMVSLELAKHGTREDYFL